MIDLSPMRLWSLHPKYLDTKGLVALWREGLLAKKVLENQTKGYRNHPQLERFKRTTNPLANINAYLHSVCDEADARGYEFDRNKLAKRRRVISRVPVKRGQVDYEWNHLMKKLKTRSLAAFKNLNTVVRPGLHPLFRKTSGGVESWEVQMKTLVLAILLAASPVRAISNQKAVANQFSCVFPNRSGQMIMETCVEKKTDGSLELSKSALKKIIFDKHGLAGGSIGNEGCFWINKKGLVRKTQCYDNGADYFKEGLARSIGSGGLMGYMDLKLDEKIPTQYTFAFPFEDGVAKVCSGCKSVRFKDDGHSRMLGGQWMIIDKAGRVLAGCPGATDFDECQMPH